MGSDFRLEGLKLKGFSKFRVQSSVGFWAEFRV
jgi:hypothetical protein